MTRALILQARLLSAEHLEGENKYHCAFCESKVDATRQIRLHCVRRSCASPCSALSLT